MKKFTRRSMPQIDTKNHKEFLRFLETSNISYSEKEISPDSLKALQGQFDNKKIEFLVKKYEKSTKKADPILVSKDNYVLDGNHRWLAHKKINKKIPAYIIDVDSSAILTIMKLWPKSYTKKLNENKI